MNGEESCVPLDVCTIAVLKARNQRSRRVESGEFAVKERARKKPACKVGLGSVEIRVCGSRDQAFLAASVM